MWMKRTVSHFFSAEFPTAEKTYNDGCWLAKSIRSLRKSMLICISFHSPYCSAALFMILFVMLILFSFHSAQCCIAYDIICNAQETDNENEEGCHIFSIQLYFIFQQPSKKLAIFMKREISFYSTKFFILRNLLR